MFNFRKTQISLLKTLQRQIRNPRFNPFLKERENFFGTQFLFQCNKTIFQLIQLAFFGGETQVRFIFIFRCFCLGNSALFTPNSKIIPLFFRCWVKVIAALLSSFCYRELSFTENPWSFCKILELSAEQCEEIDLELKNFLDMWMEGCGSKW